MYKMIQWAYIILPVTYVACLLVAFFKCTPFDHQWQISPFPGSKLRDLVSVVKPERCLTRRFLDNCEPAISTLQTVFVMVMNTVTDFYLLAIPAPMVWKSNLPPKKKIILLIMFS